MLCGVVFLWCVILCKGQSNVQIPKIKCNTTTLGGFCGNPCGAGRWLLDALGKKVCCPVCHGHINTIGLRCATCKSTDQGNLYEGKYDTKIPVISPSTSKADHVANISENVKNTWTILIGFFLDSIQNFLTAIEPKQDSDALVNDGETATLKLASVLVVCALLYGFCYGHNFDHLLSEICSGDDSDNPSGSGGGCQGPYSSGSGVISGSGFGVPSGNGFGVFSANGSGVPSGSGSGGLSGSGFGSGSGVPSSSGPSSNGSSSPSGSGIGGPSGSGSGGHFGSGSGGSSSKDSGGNPSGSGSAGHSGSKSGGSSNKGSGGSSGGPSGSGSAGHSGSKSGGSSNKGSGGGPSSSGSGRLNTLLARPLWQRLGQQIFWRSGPDFFCIPGYVIQWLCSSKRACEVATTLAIIFFFVLFWVIYVAFIADEKYLKV